MRLDEVIRRFENTVEAPNADYQLVSASKHRPGAPSYARTREGTPSLLIPVKAVGHNVTRLTQGLSVSAVPKLEYASGAERWSEPCVVVECRAPALLHTFAALTIAFVAKFEAERPSLDQVIALFDEWEALLGHRHRLSDEAELGLWGELFCISSFSRPDDLVAAWRGPHGDPLDFLFDGKGFELKTSRRKGVHHVSQSQVDAPLGPLPTFFLSLFVAVDPLRGSSLPVLVSRVGSSVSDFRVFEEKLAATGFSRQDVELYQSRFLLVEPPAIFSADAIPRVRQADPGVSQLRYRVELSSDATVDHVTATAVLMNFGLSSSAEDYPCA